MKKYFITESSNILQALEQLEKSGRGILFLQNNGKLLGTVTDGDIRRWILQKGDLNASIKCIANYQPKYLYEEQSDVAVQAMKKFFIDSIPIVDKNRIIKKIVFCNQTNEEKKRFEQKLPVVIMAGGMGTRLSPYTNILPKPLIPIGELPIVEHIINHFVQYGCDEYFMVVNYKRNMIKAYFNDLERSYSIKFVTEEKKLGTGGGLSLLKEKICSTFILTNCDILIEDDLTKAYEYHKEAQNVITMICSLKNFTIPYGVVEVTDGGMIKAIQEKPDMSFLTNTGCYIVEARVIEELEYNEPIDFPSIVQKYMSAGENVGAYPINENAWLDMGQLDELERMKERLKQE